MLFDLDDNEGEEEVCLDGDGEEDDDARCDCDVTRIGLASLFTNGFETVSRVLMVPERNYKRGKMISLLYSDIW